VINTLSRPAWTVRNTPGAPMSAARAAQNHIRAKISSCSRSKIDGSVYDAPGRVGINDSVTVTP
jgi:hypothetical protein